MLRISNREILYILFFIMIWIFFSLNSRYFQPPNALILRWVAMGTLVFAVLFNAMGRVPLPPAIVWTLILAALPGFFVSMDMTESFIKICCFVVVVYSGYIFFSSLDTEEEFETTMKIMMAIMILFEIQNIIAMLTGYGYGSGADRPTGNTTNANTLGVYSCLSLVASYYFLMRTLFIKRWFFIAMAAFSVWLIIMSGSRGSFAVMCLMFYLMFLFYVRSNLTRVFVSLLLVLTIVLMFNGFFNFLGIEALNRLTEKGGTDRGELWDFGIGVWREYPLFGCGYSTSNMHNTMVGTEGYDFHNSYLTLLCETGVVGVVLFSIVVIFDAIPALSILSIKLKEDRVDAYILCCCMMAGLAIEAYGESFLFAVGSTEACVFWMLYTWNIAYKKKYMNDEDFITEVAEDE